LNGTGSLHEIGAGKLPVPFKMYGGVGDRAMVVGAGDKGKKLADRLIDVKGTGGKAPLFAMTYDYGKLIELVDKLDRHRDDDFGDQLNMAFAKLFGRSVMTVDVTDKGVALWGSLDMR
jgi:hypothetical protein